MGIPLVITAVAALGKAEKERNEKRGVKVEPLTTDERGLLAFPEKR